jgi:hypothetical protein
MCLAMISSLALSSKSTSHSPGQSSRPQAWTGPCRTWPSCNQHTSPGMGQSQDLGQPAQPNSIPRLLPMTQSTDANLVTMSSTQAISHGSHSQMQKLCSSANPSKEHSVDLCHPFAVTPSLPSPQSTRTNVPSRFHPTQSAPGLRHGHNLGDDDDLAVALAASSFFLLSLRFPPTDSFFMLSGQISKFLNCPSGLWTFSLGMSSSQIPHRVGGHLDPRLVNTWLPDGM